MPHERPPMSASDNQASSDAAIGAAMAVVYYLAL